MPRVPGAQGRRRAEDRRVLAQEGRRDHQEDDHERRRQREEQQRRRRRGRNDRQALRARRVRQDAPLLAYGPRLRAPERPPPVPLQGGADRRGPEGKEGS